MANSSSGQTTTPKGRPIRCQYCPQKYYSHYSVYISHLNHSHRQQLGLQSDIVIESRTLNDFNEFSKFKLQLEYQTGTHFYKSNSRADSYWLFKCDRFGKPRSYSEKSPKKRLPERSWTQSCPAFIRVIKTENDKYGIEYCTYHLGHDDINQPMPLFVASRSGNQHEGKDESVTHQTNIKTEPYDDESVTHQTNIRTEPCNDESTDHTKMVSILIPQQHRTLIETIVQLIQNEENRESIDNLITSMTKDGRDQRDLHGGGGDGGQQQRKRSKKRKQPR